MTQPIAAQTRKRPLGSMRMPYTLTQSAASVPRRAALCLASGPAPHSGQTGCSTPTGSRN